MNGVSRGRRCVSRTVALELTHELGHHRRVVAAHMEEEALEVGRDGDVHRGRDRLGDARARVVTRAELAVEDVVEVGGRLLE